MKKIHKITAVLLAIICIVFSFSACSGGEGEKAQLTTFANATTKAYENGTIVAESVQTDEASTTAKGSTSTTAQSTSQNGTTKKQDNPSTSAPTTAKNTATTKKQAATAAKTTKKVTTTKKANAPPKSEEVCYITIECKSILKHLGDLKPGHEKYVPSDGYLLRKYSCTYKSGDTAYDILKRGCAAQHIKITAQDTVYGVYIAGINNIDEKDCGDESGWLYSVNGKFPSITCGKQNVKPNDEILFTYTCEY